MTKTWWVLPRIVNLVVNFTVGTPIKLRYEDIPLKRTEHSKDPKYLNIAPQLISPTYTVTVSWLWRDPDSNAKWPVNNVLSALSSNCSTCEGVKNHESLFIAENDTWQLSRRTHERAGLFLSPLLFSRRLFFHSRPNELAQPRKRVSLARLGWPRNR